MLIGFRTGLVLIVLFILTKCMGKKQVSQMNIYDYLIGITIGSIAADISLDIEKNLVAGMLSLIIFGLSGVLVTFLTLKSIKLRRLIVGVPTVLMDDGKIIENHLYKEGIDINDLQEEARKQGYFDLSKINYAILETSGNISFLAKTDELVVTRKDMKIKTNNEGLWGNIIIDGELLENNLCNMNKDKKWLDKELKKRGYDDYKNILLLMVNDHDELIVYEKNINNNVNILE